MSIRPPGGAGSPATSVSDLPDRTNETSETVPAGSTTNSTTAGITKTAPAVDAVVATPPKRWAVRNGSTGTITVSYPDTVGATVNLTMLAGEVLTFRQKTTVGYAAESGNKTAASLAPRRAVTSAAYAATVTPDVSILGADQVVNVGALTGNITFANPTGTPVDGQNITLRLVQDATGSRTVSFGTNYAFGTDITAALIPTTASSKSEMLFSWNATDSKWRAKSIVRGF